MLAPLEQPVRCVHCGTAMEDAHERFCCAGCELAYQIVENAGLERWYNEREAAPSRPEPLRAADWASVPVARRDDGLNEACLAIDGLHCASCVWVVEKVLEGTSGVDHVKVSYATGRAIVRWDPAATDIAALGSRIAALGYTPRPTDARPATDRDVMVRLGVAAFLTANVMGMAAALYAGAFDGMETKYAQLFRWGSLALSTPVALWSAVPFYQGAWGGLKHRVLHMDLPIAMAVLGVWAHGVWATFHHVDSYVDSLGMLVTLLLAGRVAEARGRRAAADAASAIAAQLPSKARRLIGDGVEDVSASALRVGDRVVVGLGDEVPADGTVIDGEARLRMALLTGEAEPVAVAVGSRVVAGAEVAEGALTLRVDAAGADTVGMRMAAAVANSVDQGLTETPADRLAPWFVGGTLVVASLAFAGWSWTHGVHTGIEVAAAVLVVACPCALGLSYPVAVSAGLAAAARRGLVLRSGDALLRLARVDTVALDKTGTVTGGVPRVVEADDATLRIAAALERSSSHPIAKAILDEAARRGLALARATLVHEAVGRGIGGVVDGTRYSLGSGGAGRVVLRSDAGELGAITLRDVRRDDAAPAVARLQARATVVMLTGDDDAAAAAVAGGLGLTEVHARMTPDAKQGWIRDARALGRSVLFVGDGLNDGPALAAADVGLAMRAGATSSVLAADGVVVDDAVGPVVAALRVAEVVRATVTANMVRSVIYNLTAVAAATAGLVNPLVAAVLMPLSSAMVLYGALAVEGRVAREEAR